MASKKRQIMDCVFIDIEPKKTPTPCLDSSTSECCSIAPLNGQRKPKPFPRLHPNVSSSAKAGLTFPVGRVRRYLKQKTEKRLTKCAAGKNPVSVPSCFTELIS